MFHLAKELELGKVLPVALYELHRWYPPQPLPDDSPIFVDEIAIHEEILSKDDLKICLFSGTALRSATLSRIRAIMASAELLRYSRTDDADHAGCSNAMETWLKDSFFDIESFAIDSFMRNPVGELKSMEDRLTRQSDVVVAPSTCASRIIVLARRAMLNGLLLYIWAVDKVCHACRASVARYVRSERDALWSTLPQIAKWSGEHVQL